MEREIYNWDGRAEITSTRSLSAVTCMPQDIDWSSIISNCKMANLIDTACLIHAHDSRRAWPVRRRRPSQSSAPWCLRVPSIKIGAEHRARSRAVDLLRCMAAVCRMSENRQLQKTPFIHWKTVECSKQGTTVGTS